MYWSEKTMSPVISGAHSPMPSRKGTSTAVEEKVTLGFPQLKVSQQPPSSTSSRPRQTARAM